MMRSLSLGASGGGPGALWQRLRPYLVVDAPLALCIVLLMSTGLLTLYSASMDFPGRFALQLRHVLVALGVMWVVANVPPQVLMRHAAAIYGFDRVMTLIDPSADPLGKGFQVLQAGIAIGSGGVAGKGWMEGGARAGRRRPGAAAPGSAYPQRSCV